LKEEGRAKVEELQEELKIKAVKHEEERVAWEKEREEWVSEKKRLGTWKVRCLYSEKKMSMNIKELEEDYEELKEKKGGLESELEDDHIIQEHINCFYKGLRQVTFFFKEVDATDSKYDVNKDIVDGHLVDEVDSSAEQVKEVHATDGKDPTCEEDIVIQVEIDHVVYLFLI